MFYTLSCSPFVLCPCTHVLLPAGEGMEKMDLEDSKAKQKRGVCQTWVEDCVGSLLVIYIYYVCTFSVMLFSVLQVAKPSRRPRRRLDVSTHATSSCVSPLSQLGVSPSSLGPSMPCCSGLVSFNAFQIHLWYGALFRTKITRNTCN